MNISEKFLKVLKGDEEELKEEETEEKHSALPCYIYTEDSGLYFKAIYKLKEYTVHFMSSNSFHAKKMCNLNGFRYCPLTSLLFIKEKGKENSETLSTFGQSFEGNRKYVLLCDDSHLIPTMNDLEVVWKKVNFESEKGENEERLFTPKKKGSSLESSNESLNISGDNLQLSKSENLQLPKGEDGMELEEIIELGEESPPNKQTKVNKGDYEEFFDNSQDLVQQTEPLLEDWMILDTEREDEETKPLKFKINKVFKMNWDRRNIAEVIRFIIQDSIDHHFKILPKQLHDQERAIKKVSMIKRKRFVYQFIEK